VSALTPIPERTLAELEEVIAAGLQTFVEVGQALMEIRDGRLYRDSHETFEIYCRERWSIGSSRARQLIAAAESVTTVTIAGLPAPTNERQARELVALLDQPDELREAWARASSDGKPTALKVREVVRKRGPRHNTSPYEPDTERKRQLANKQYERISVGLAEVNGFCGRLHKLDYGMIASVASSEDLEGLSERISLAIRDLRFAWSDLTAAINAADPGPEPE
jgi:hypothetical protein